MKRNNRPAYLKPAFCFCEACTTYAFRLFVNERRISCWVPKPGLRSCIAYFYDTKYAIITYICKKRFMYLRTECCFFYGFHEIRSINNQKPYHIHKLEIIDSFQWLTYPQRHCLTNRKGQVRPFSISVIGKRFQDHLAFVMKKIENRIQKLGQETGKRTFISEITIFVRQYWHWITFQPHWFTCLYNGIKYMYMVKFWFCITLLAIKTLYEISVLWIYCEIYPTF